MTIDERMDKLEKAFGSQDALVRELRDAVTVTATLEARQSRLLREHSEWLVSHDRSMQEHHQWLVSHDAAMKALGERIEGLVSGIGEFMRRGKE
jgi:uncharacterized coiled-coil protein SlyX